MSDAWTPLVWVAIGFVLAIKLWFLFWISDRFAGRREEVTGVRQVARSKVGRVFASTRGGQRVEVDPDDPTDPMHDPDVREMLAEVVRTGRPMRMRRGEPPVFIDEDDEDEAR